MISTTVTTDTSGVNPFLAAVLDGLNDGLTGAAIEIANVAKESMSLTAIGQSSRPGSPPSVQTGRLRNSVTSTPGRNLVAYAGTNVHYGLTQERGAVITPKTTKYVTIPLNKEARRMRATTPGSLRARKLVFIRSGHGNLLLANKKASGGLKPLFLLKPSVTLPPRPWLRPALENGRGRWLKAFERDASESIFRRVKSIKVAA